MNCQACRSTRGIVCGSISAFAGRNWGEQRYISGQDGLSADRDLNPFTKLLSRLTFDDTGDRKALLWWHIRDS